MVENDGKTAILVLSKKLRTPNLNHGGYVANYFKFIILDDKYN